MGPPGSQLVHRHCPHLAGSEEQTCPWGELWPPAVLQHLLGQGTSAPALLFKSIITGDYFQPKQRRCVCVLQVSARYLCGGCPVRLLGGGKSCTAASCTRPTPSPVWGSATPRVPARSAKLHSRAGACGFVFSPPEGTVTPRPWTSRLHGQVVSNAV